MPSFTTLIIILSISVSVAIILWQIADWIYHYQSNRETGRAFEAQQSQRTNGKIEATPHMKAEEEVERPEKEGQGKSDKEKVDSHIDQLFAHFTLHQYISNEDVRTKVNKSLKDSKPSAQVKDSKKQSCEESPNEKTRTSYEVIYSVDKHVKLSEIIDRIKNLVRNKAEERGGIFPSPDNMESLENLLVSPNLLPAEIRNSLRPAVEIEISRGKRQYQPEEEIDKAITLAEEAFRKIERPTNSDRNS